MIQDVNNQVDWSFPFSVGLFCIMHSKYKQNEFGLENSLQRLISYLGFPYLGTFLNGQSEDFIYILIYNFLSSWQFKELYNVAFELIKTSQLH